MKYIVFFLFTIFLILFGCGREDLSVQIIRTPLIKCDLDSATWKADHYFFTGPARVVVYPSSNAQTGILYNRFTLQATGLDSKGRQLQLNLVFDAADSSQLTGLYKVAYTSLKGLQQVQLFQIGTTLSAYALCPGNSTQPFLLIQKQSNTERLITGTFQLTLCNTQDTTQKINIKNGVLNDIHY